MILKAARCALFAVVPAELLAVVLLASGAPLPAPLLVAAEAAAVSVLSLEAAAACGLYRAAVRGGADRRTALRTTFRRLVPVAVRRLVRFELLGVASIGLWLARRRHGVPRGAAAVPYSGEQSAFLLLILFATVLETAAVEALLHALGAPVALRVVVLVLDAYGVCTVLAVWAAGVTRPHVVSPAELRVRYGVFADVRVPLRLVGSVRTSRNDNERGTVSVDGERLAVAVSSRTNVLVELVEPVTFARPLGSEARVASIRFFADDPRGAAAVLRAARPAPEPPRERPAPMG